jgi:FdhD protein
MTDDDGGTSLRTPAPVWNWQAGRGDWNLDELAIEEPLEIRVQGQAISVTMRTPGHDAELALGFLLTEQVIATAADVVSVRPCCVRESGRNITNVRLAPQVTVDMTRLTRHVFASSSCGLCGKTTIDAIAQHFPYVTSELEVPALLIASLPDAMRQAQLTFAHTGGLHAAALFDARGNLLVLREDVGRHNAVDKVLGHAMTKGWLPLDRHVLLVSGRLSFEIMQKSLAGAIPIVAAVSAPSSLAVDFANRSGQTLVGFVRDGRANVYTHASRVLRPALQGTP